MKEGPDGEKDEALTHGVALIPVLFNYHSGRAGGTEQKSPMAGLGLDEHIESIVYVPFPGRVSIHHSRMHGIVSTDNVN